MAKFRFSIDDSIFKLFPKLKIAGLYIQNFEIKENHTELVSNLRANSTEDALRIGSELLNHPKISQVETKLQEINFPKEVTTSHIALVKRVNKDKRLPEVSPLVDCYNSFSLANLIPTGGHDVHGIEGISVTTSNGGEKFQQMNSEKIIEVEANEPAYISSQGDILTRYMIYRQSEKSKISENSKEIFIPFDDLTDLFRREELNKIAMDLVSVLQEIANFDYEFKILDKFLPFVEFNNPQNKKQSLPYIAKKRGKVITDERKIEEFFDHKLDQTYPSKELFLEALKSGKRLKFYIGADATGPNLHLGHLIPVLKMRQLQELGHQIIFLVGDFTARIGDPTDKSETRIMLSDEEVNRNANTFKKQIARYIDFDRDVNPAQLLFNSEWNDSLNFKDAIKLAANTTVQQMLERDMFEQRMNENKPIFLHEFFYPLIQGYDSVAMNVDGEFGGRDQTFNMLMGRTLLKSYYNHEKFVFTFHFLLSADGKNKMSKSIGNCIFINDEPQDKFAKVMAIPDDLIPHYYKYATNKPISEIQEIEQELSKTYDPLAIKKELAYEIVKLNDGEEAAQKAYNYFANTIQDNQVPEDAFKVPIKVFKGKTELRLKIFLNEINKYRIIKVSSKLIQEGSTKEGSTNFTLEHLSASKLLKVGLKTQLELLSSNARIKNLVKSGAIEINGRKATDINEVVIIDEIEYIRVGKKYWLKIIK